MAYLIVLFVLACLCLIEYSAKGNRIARIGIAGCCFTILSFFAGLRKVGVGKDDHVYLSAFERMRPITDWFSGFYQYDYFDSRMEIGYSLLMAIVAQFTDSHIVLFLLIGVFTAGATVYQLTLRSPYIALSAMLYFSHSYLYRDMNQMRAAIACALGLFFIHYLSSKRLIASTIIVGIASTFHMGALIYLPCLFLARYELPRWSLALFLATAICFAITGVTMLLFSVLPDLGAITIKLNGYAKSEQYAATIPIYDLTNLKNFSLIMLGMYFWETLVKGKRYYLISFTLIVIGTCWRVAFGEFGIVAARIATFFMVSEIIFFSYLCTLIKPKSLAIAIVIIYAVVQLALNIEVKEIVEFYETSIL